MKRKTLITEILILVLSIALTIGVKHLFHACIHEDGSYGTCHWAEQAVFAFGIVLCFEAAIHLFIRGSEAKAAASICIIPTAGICMIVPKTLIPLCMMDTMSCNMRMRPFVFVLCILIVALSAIDGVLNISLIQKSRREGRL